MSCAEFRERFEPGEGRDGHTLVCPRCREWAERQRRAINATGRLASALAMAGARPDLEAELRAAFRRARAEPRAQGRRWTRIPLAAAACVLLAVAGVWLRASLGQRPQGSEPQGAAAPAPRSAQAGLLRERPPTRVVGGLATVGARRPRARTPAPALPPRRPSSAVGADPPEQRTAVLSDLEKAQMVVVTPSVDVPPKPTPGPTGESDAREFYSLLGEPDPSVVDSGQIVRVQLRGDALGATGLTGPTDVWGRVEAEVLVGPDGVARGIRIARPRR